jgi:hypothetical protein
MLLDPLLTKLWINGRSLKPAQAALAIADP